MPLLLYCVADLSAQLNTKTGVAGSPVSRFEHSGLVVFHSENATADAWLGAPLPSSAEDFHRIQRELFRSSPIIPFRFPTILENREKLREHMDERSDEYKALLQRFATCVQIDLTLTYKTAPSESSSGANYLRQRQSRNRALEQFASELRNQGEPLIKDWRERSVPNALRCFALLERKHVQEFNEKMKTLSVPAELSARISGPWPVAEFLDFRT